MPTAISFAFALERRATSGSIVGETRLVGDLRAAIGRVRAGDQRAFRVVVERTSASLVRLAARMTGTLEEGEDVVQEAYVKAYRAIIGGNFEGRSAPETWLYRIVANTAIDHIRQRIPAQAYANCSLGLPAEAPAAEATLALRELAEWLDELPAEQKAALILKSVEGKSSLEIAAILGCTEGAVEQKLVRARTALRGRGRNVTDDA